MKPILIIVFLGFSPLICSQDTIKNFAGLQFGGQALVGWTYEILLVRRNNFKMNGSLGIALHEYADDQDPLDRPIYGMNIGLIALYDLKYVFAEAGMFSSPYFYKS